MSMFIGKEGFDVHRTTKFHEEVDATVYTTTLSFEVYDEVYIKEEVASSTLFGHWLSDQMAEVAMRSLLREFSDNKLGEGSA